MNQKIHQIRQYIRHQRQAKSRIGHGIHSPFVYELVEQVFNHSGNYYCYPKIEKYRQQLLTFHSVLNIEDFGAGSTKNNQKERKVSEIAKTALLNPEHAQLLFRLVNRFQPQTIIELGTSLGITSAYLASAYKQAQIYTFEGSPEIAQMAQKTFKKLKMNNIQQITTSFDDTLPQTLEQINTVDFAFIDGNHRYEPTLRYFEQLLEKASEHSVFVFDDIYWSEGMTRAWNKIISHPKVTVSIDIYRMGLVFFRKSNPKQNFKIKF